MVTPLGTNVLLPKAPQAVQLNGEPELPSPCQAVQVPDSPVPSVKLPQENTPPAVSVGLAQVAVASARPDMTPTAAPLTKVAGVPATKAIFARTQLYGSAWVPEPDQVEQLPTSLVDARVKLQEKLLPSLTGLTQLTVSVAAEGVTAMLTPFVALAMVNAAVAE